jgi:beta-glucosidase
MSRTPLLAFALVLVLLPSFAGAQAPAVADKPAAQAPAAKTAVPEPVDPKATVIPAPREGKWMDRHNQISERAKQGDVDLLFIGDSITQGWEGAGKGVWAKYYGSRKAMNAGIGGDRTQHVLWRLDNGNLDNINPKLAVLMIGTNNSRDHQPEDIAAGVKAIVEKLRSKLPQTKILVLAIFPRGPDAQNPNRKTNEATNEIIRKLADDSMIYYLDIGANFTAPDSSLVKAQMPDLLHLSPVGYAIWAESIEPTVAKLLGETPAAAAKK